MTDGVQHVLAMADCFDCVYKVVFEIHSFVNVKLTGTNSEELFSLFVFTPEYAVVLYHKCAFRLLQFPC